MFTKIPFFLKEFLALGFIMLSVFSFSACATQPALTPTSVLPTQVLPSPTAISPTPDLDLVSSLDEIVGKWKTLGCGTLIFEIRDNGTYRFCYLVTTQGEVTNVDLGKLTISGNEIHLESTWGYCESMANGFYHASLTLEDSKPYNLRFMAIQKDECSDRQDSVSRDMKYFTE